MESTCKKGVDKFIMSHKAYYITHSPQSAACVIGTIIDAPAIVQLSNGTLKQIDLTNVFVTK